MDKIWVYFISKLNLFIISPNCVDFFLVVETEKKW